jgi:hypothetical protein
LVARRQDTRVCVAVGGVEGEMGHLVRGEEGGGRVVHVCCSVHGVCLDEFTGQTGTVGGVGQLRFRCCC